MQLLLGFLRYCTKRWNYWISKMELLLGFFALLWNCLPLTVGEKCDHFLEDRIASSYCKVSSSVCLCVFVIFLS